MIQPLVIQPLVLPTPSLRTAALRRLGGAAALTLALFSGGCAAGDSPAPEDPERSADGRILELTDGRERAAAVSLAAPPLVLAQTRRGAALAVHEIDPGEFLVISDESGGPEPALERLRERSAAITTVFEEATGQPSPPALQEAHARGLREARRALSPAELADYEGPAEPMRVVSDAAQRFTGESIGVVRSALSASGFQDRYCDLGIDFNFCHPQTTGTKGVHGRAWAMTCRVEAIDHATEWRFRRKKGLKMSTVRVDSSLPGQGARGISWVKYGLYRRYLEFDAFGRPGRPYRFWCGGSD